MEDKVAEYKIPSTKIFLVFLYVALKFYCQLSGVLSQQGELAIMNSLGVINSVRDWVNFNWQDQVDAISKLPLSHENANPSYEECVKTILKWVVMTRMIIAHLYTATYIANFYPILTLCRGKLLVPWLAMSAIKNFILEVIVLIVVVLLYLQNHLSIYLLCEFFIHKLVTLAPAVYNWLTINSFYTELKIINRKKLARLDTSMFSRKSSIVYNHPNIIIGLPMQSIKPYHQEAINSKLGPPKRVSSLINYHRPSGESPRDIRFTKSLSWTLITRREIDFFIAENSQSHSRKHQEEMSEASTSSSCDCPIIDNQQESLNSDDTTSKETVIIDQELTIDSSQSNFLPQQDWFLKKMNNRLNLHDYTNLLNQYNNDTESSKWSSDEEIDDQQSCTTIINNFTPQLNRTAKPATKIESNQWRRRLEIVGSSFESTLQYYNETYESQSSKLSSINDLGLSRSWILDGMIITGTVNNKKNSNYSMKIDTNRQKQIEIEALKAYNMKTLWEDRLNHKKSPKDLKKRKMCEKEFQGRKTFEIINFDSSNNSSMKRAIASLDWSLKSFTSPILNSFPTNSRPITDENDTDSSVLNPATDNTSNTMELLLFAFGYSDRSGFNFIPTSGIYSLPGEIPNVFDEIIKTARVRAIKHDCNYRSTADVDYGEKYWSNAKCIS